MLSLKGIATKMNGLHVATYPAERTLSFMERPIPCTSPLCRGISSRRALTTFQRKVSRSIDPRAGAWALREERLSSSLDDWASASQSAKTIA
jgi:hypothetical protein